MQNIDLIFTSVFEVKMKEHSFHFYVIVQLQFFWKPTMIANAYYSTSKSGWHEVDVLTKYNYIWNLKKVKQKWNLYCKCYESSCRSVQKYWILMQ